jgi:hypothetical protein
MDAGNTVRDTTDRRWVFNLYNQVDRVLSRRITSGDWTCTSTSWGMANGHTAPSLSFLIGWPGSRFQASVQARCVNSNSGASAYVGLSSGGDTAGILASSIQAVNPTQVEQTIVAREVENGIYSVSTQEHQLNWLEKTTSGNTATFRGSNTQTENGIFGTVRM